MQKELHNNKNLKLQADLLNTACNLKSEKNNKNSTNNVVSKLNDICDNTFISIDKKNVQTKRGKVNIAKTLLFRITILVLASYFCGSGYFADEAVAATATDLKKELNIDSRQLSWIYSVGFGPNIIVILLGGILIDRYGVRLISFIYMTGIVVGMGVFALVPNYYGKILGRFIFGLVFEPLEVCQDAIFIRWFGQEQRSNNNQELETISNSSDSASTSSSYSSANTTDADEDGDYEEGEQELRQENSGTITETQEENDSSSSENDDEKNEKNQLKSQQKNKSQDEINHSILSPSITHNKKQVVQDGSLYINLPTEEEIDQEFDQNSNEGGNSKYSCKCGCISTLLSPSNGPSLPLAFGVSFATGILGQAIGLNLVPSLVQVLGGVDYAYLIITAVCVTAWIANISFIALDFYASKRIPSLDGVKHDHEVEENDSTLTLSSSSPIDVDTKPSGGKCSLGTTKTCYNPLTTVKKFPKTYWILMIVSTIGFSCQYVFMVYASDYLNEKWNYTPTDAGHLSSIVYGIAVVLSPLVGFFIERKGHCLTLMGLGCILFSFSCMILAVVPVGIIHPSIVLCVMGVAYALVPSSVWSAIAIIVPETSAGMAYSVMTALASLSLLIFPYIVGALHDALDGYDSMNYLFALCGVLSALVVCFADRSLQIPQNAGQTNNHEKIKQQMKEENKEACKV